MDFDFNSVKKINKTKNFSFYNEDEIKDILNEKFRIGGDFLFDFPSHKITIIKSFQPLQMFRLLRYGKNETIYEILKHFNIDISSGLFLGILRYNDEEIALLESFKGFLNTEFYIANVSQPLYIISEIFMKICLCKFKNFTIHPHFFIQLAKLVDFDFNGINISFSKPLEDRYIYSICYIIGSRNININEFSVKIDNPQITYDELQRLKNNIQQATKAKNVIIQNQYNLL